MSSPIETWEGAEAYFTFADNPFMLGLILFLSVAVTVGVIVSTFKHEAESYKDYED